MQTVKDHIKSDILQSAATLFLEKGYLKVPMREIAHKSGVGLSNIYNYFSCKDDIFVQIVTPAVRTFENMLDEHHGRRGTDIMVMCDRDYFKYMVDEYTSFIHRHRDLLLLLLFRSQGSSLENYKEEFARKSTAPCKTPLHKSIKKIIRRIIILINHRTIHKLIYYIRKESHFFAKSSIVLPS